MPSEVGRVRSLWRYPVKSMLGERLEEVEVTTRGLFGDRDYAVVDAATGKVASAKSPRKWGRLFRFGAALAPRTNGRGTPEVEITLPSGATLNGKEEGLDQVLSEELGRQVVLRSAASEGSTPAYEYDSSEEGIGEGTVTEQVMPEGTFFDEAPVHLLTTTTLDYLRRAHPQSDFDARRFRPNILIEPSEQARHSEEDWVGRTLAIGDAVLLRVTGRCLRCVMVNLAQQGLPKDPGVLKTVAGQNGGYAGAYAAVLRGGRVRVGDPVVLD